ncbi:MAG: MarC family protein [Bacteroides sp.]|nr:MarC family protein [Bacteroides sp.]MCM1085011.1 MarC family protein [Bacteroides sp.]
MENLGVLALSVFTSLFAIVNPVVNIPIFLDLTSSADAATKKKVAKMSTVTAFFIVFVFLILGKSIFDFLGITIPAFRITGGILLFYVGFELLSSKKSSIQSNTGKPVAFDESVAISPLAIPMLAGPGTIVAAMNYTANQDYIGMAVIALMLALVMFITYLAFIFSERIFKVLGSNIIMVLGKLMGLIVAIMGTNMVLDGIKTALLS